MLRLTDLLLDLNGTLAVDGSIPDVVSTLVCRLAKQVHVSLLTANTFGTAEDIAGRLGLELVLLNPEGDEAAQKAEVVEKVGPAGCVAVGNGANDVQMLQASRLGIAVLGREGLFAPLLVVADIVVTDPVEALELLLQPSRLIATLRR
ncbi:MAG: hypothetical protein C4521_08875 [Actinobacteria bacterium]|nr:MAG: hypothetical protein C4521_08875 [Actinomycetota bacterium]